MMFGIGLAVLFGMVFGGFLIAGGHMEPILHSLPYELMIIGGAAIGAMIIGNSIRAVKHLGGSFAKILKGPRWKDADYMSAILLVGRLTKLMKDEGPVAVEPHVEEPQTSDIFKDYPTLLADHFFVSYVTDALRLQVIAPGGLDPFQVEEVMDSALKTHLHHEEESVHMLESLADGLPALGIVAAVLGVIKTMGSIDQPPAVLGAMIGSALVGTFLGVFMAYGIAAPCASRLKQVLREEAELYHVAKQIIVASIRNSPQALVIEAARTSISAHNQPTFAAVFDGLREAA
ncbi:flagellar motor stator protein MotA [Pacificimonas flava]|uniref:Flagellar motor rotation protein MotA n=1 Tax=Pacificimonas flava TaxID=1234595 RepID=M2U848_9SPHN|nr:flagellar motor stator protein MotA [Pacificimonas flava]EMD84157.1 Flagellar motor rotation protein MotA [Pacificimonas flava]MBB5279965.1 chemotaxis protein MotA [Pacificimonas flava]